MNCEPSPASDERSLSELRVLVLKLNEGEANESECERLGELMQSADGAEEAARLIDQINAFADSGTLDSRPMADLLTQAFGGQQSEAMAARSAIRLTQPVVEPQEPRKPWPIAWIVAIAASHLLIASLTWSISRSGREDASAFSMATDPVPTAPNVKVAPPPSVSPPSVSPPQLVSMTACVWQQSSSSIPAIGQPIRSGEVLELADGVAELRIGEGTPGEALVRLEGPAGVFIRADGRLHFQHGTLTIKALHSGVEIVTIDAPVGRILLDGNTSAGLTSVDDTHEVHVFDGRGLVRPRSPGFPSDPQRLEAGQAVRFSSQADKKSDPVLFKASLARFVSARSSGFDPLKLGDAYQEVILESKPSIYWRFENLEGDTPYHVPNQGSSPDADAKVIGEVAWRRYGENRVTEIGKLGFTSAFRSTGLWPAKPLRDYTIEMWVKPEIFHHGEMICLHDPKQEESGRFAHALMLECLAQHWRNPLKTCPPNRFRYAHRSPATGEFRDGSNLISEGRYQVRLWQHVACRKEGDTISLWVDGKCVAEHTDETMLPAQMQIVIGQTCVTRPHRRFIGQIDEVALYDRCLDVAELQSHIDAAGRASHSSADDSLP